MCDALNAIKQSCHVMTCPWSLYSAASGLALPFIFPPSPFISPLAARLLKTYSFSSLHFNPTLYK